MGNQNTSLVTMLHQLTALRILVGATVGAIATGKRFDRTRILVNHIFAHPSPPHLV